MAEIKMHLEIETDWMDEIFDAKDWTKEDLAEYIKNQIMNSLSYASMVWISEEETEKLDLEKLK